MDCYCCSGDQFETCCQPFLQGRAKASTAEALMRSRFSAYAVADIDYLFNSTYPSTRRQYSRADITRWAEANRWQKLEIIATDKGKAKDKTGTVEFKAYYLDENEELKTHHELSDFRRELGRWFFVKGRILSDNDR